MSQRQAIHSIKLLVKFAKNTGTSGIVFKDISGLFISGIQHIFFILRALLRSSSVSITTMQLQQVSSSLLVCALVLLVTKMSDACSCAPSHYQTHFCRADAVIRGTIRSKSFIYGENALTDNEVYGFSSDYSYGEPLPPLVVSQVPLFVVYNVTINEVYKGEEEFVGMTTISVSSAGDGAMCGIPHLQEGETYILSGFVWDGELNIGLCSSWVEPFNLLTSFQKRGLKRIYAKTCDDCQVCSSYFWDRDCTGCTDFFVSTCANRNSACVKNSKGQCSWKYSKYHKLC